MARSRIKFQAAVEALETIMVLTTAPGVVAPSLQAFAAAYQSRVGQPRYNPALDFNHNGFIGQGDAVPILHSLIPITPRVPIKLNLALAAGQQVLGHHSANSGGVTRDTHVTVVGHTTPNSIVFVDRTESPRANNYRFEGAAIPVDSNGTFTVDFTLVDALTQTEYMVITPRGAKTIRAFPLRKV